MKDYMTINKKMLKTLSIVLVLVLIVGALTACGGGNAPAPAPQTQAPTQAPGGSQPAEPAEPAEPELGRQTIKIGIATCFTGAQARNAETQLYGLEVALKHMEESGFSKYYDFEIVQGDDQYDATEAVTVANKLVYQDNVKAVFGHLNAVVTLAALPIYEEAKVPCFTPSGSSAKIINSGYEYVYMCVPSDSIIAATLIDYLVGESGLTKIGMFYCNNDQGQSGLAYVEAALEKHSLKLTASESYVVGDTDYTGQMLNFKAAGVETIIIWGGDVTQRSTMIQQARQLISPDVLIAGEGNFSNASFISTTEPEVRNGVTFGVAWSYTFTDELSQKFTKDFTEMDPMDQMPGAVTVRFYDGMYLLVSALNELGPYDVNADDFTEKLNEKIKQVSVEGLQGTLKPAPNGECVSKSFVARFTMEGEERLS